MSTVTNNAELTKLEYKVVEDAERVGLASAYGRHRDPSQAANEFIAPLLEETAAKFPHAAEYARDYLAPLYLEAYARAVIVGQRRTEAARRLVQGD